MKKRPDFRQLGQLEKMTSLSSWLGALAQMNKMWPVSSTLLSTGGGGGAGASTFGAGLTSSAPEDAAATMTTTSRTPPPTPPTIHGVGFFRCGGTRKRVRLVAPLRRFMTEYYTGKGGQTVQFFPQTARFGSGAPPEKVLHKPTDQRRWACRYNRARSHREPSERDYAVCPCHEEKVYPPQRRVSPMRHAGPRLDLTDDRGSTSATIA